MKPLNKILFLALFLLTTSETYSANLLRQNLINAGSKENALILYRLYSNSEKASVWSDKITQVLSLNIWNSSQINLLNNLHGEINSQIFDTTSQAFINFNGFMQNWKTQALSHFNIVQLRFIVTIVMDYNPMMFLNQVKAMEPSVIVALVVTGAVEH
ncbi:MAG: bacteriocin fulvocin C-related protein [Bacteroidetes bacterium]|nr:bacteriocin fulvocin C-related protein [Bacteroidota bacterium]